MGQHLSFINVGKAVGGKKPESEPDWGNPTVRDRRGACGNVGDGGITNPLHRPKGCRSEIPSLNSRAPYFYPNHSMRRRNVKDEVKTGLLCRVRDKFRGNLFTA